MEIKTNNNFYRNVHGAVFKIVDIINDISFLIECLKKKEILFLKNDKKKLANFKSEHQ